MKSVLFYIILFFVSVSYAQRDSIPLGSKYKEDQIYLSILYNQLFNQPNGVSASSFSYGLNIGFIKDIILNKKGSWAFGLGLGYAFDSFNHGLQIENTNNLDQFSVNNSQENRMQYHSVEVPVEFRWRNSNAQKYKFWRIYSGFKFSYAFANNFKTVGNGTNSKTSNIDSFNNLQYGLTFSAGYDAFNLHVYYSLSPIFKDISINGQSIDSKVLRIGIVIYIL